MSSATLSPTIRCLLVGETGVGKSTLCLQYFNPNRSNNFPPETVVDPYCVTVSLSPYRTVDLQVWDSAGWNEFLMTDWGQGYHDVLLICFSLESIQSIKTAQKLWSQSKKFLSNIWRRIPAILVGLKADLKSQPTIEKIQSKAKSFMSEIGGERRLSGYIEVAALENLNVNETFHAAIHAAITFKNVLFPPPPKPQEIGLPDFFASVQAQPRLKLTLQSLQPLSSFKGSATPTPRSLLTETSQQLLRGHSDSLWELESDDPKPLQIEQEEQPTSDIWNDSLFQELICAFEKPSLIPLHDNFDPHYWMRHLLHSIGMSLPESDTDHNSQFRQYSPATRVALQYQLDQLINKGHSALCVPPSFAPPDPPDSHKKLARIYTSRVQRKWFSDFLVSILAEENLNFLCAVGSYKKIHVPFLRQKRAHFIYNKYIKRDAPFQINIKSDTLANIEMNLVSGNLNLFDTAEAEITKILETFCLPEFMNRLPPGSFVPSPEHKQLQHQHSAYSEITPILVAFNAMNIAPFVEFPSVVHLSTPQVH